MHKVSDSIVFISERSFLVKVVFQVKQGLHIQSNNPENENVIPTKVVMEWPSGVEAFDPIFPSSEKLVLEGTDEALHVYSKEFEIKMAVSYQDDTLKGSYTVPGKITYQACDDKRCFYPRDYQFSINMELN